MPPLKDKFLFLLCLLLAGYASLAFAERADRDKPMQMEADRVTVDDANQTSIFEGNVQMRQGTLFIEAARILIAQDKNGFSQITASGEPAHLRQKRDGVNEFTEGFGERIEYDTFAEIANFFGKARVKRDDDDVRGEHIIYNTKTGVFQVFGNNSQTPETPGRGRVTIVIQPKDKSQETVPNTQTPSVSPSANPAVPQP